jgi:hypothetical protein
MASPSSPVMVGGAKFQDTVLEWSKQSLNLYTIVFAALIIVWALFVDKLPSYSRWQLSSTPGRLLLLLLLYIVHNTYGWTMALIFTIAVALTWASRPILIPSSFTEGFNDMKYSEAGPHRWFVEKTLHQYPKAIIEDRIKTLAVEEDSPTVSGRTSK